MEIFAIGQQRIKHSRYHLRRVTDILVDELLLEASGNFSRSTKDGFIEDSVIEFN